MVTMNSGAYFELIRPWNCAMAAVAVFAGFAVSGGGFGLAIPLLLAVFSAFAICGAGQAINDYYDAEIDAKLGPEKPIPSGRVGRKAARNFALVLFAAGIAVSYFINMHAFAIAAAYSCMLFAYSWAMGEYKFLGNWVVALGTALTMVYGAAITENYCVVAYLAACALFANAGREIIKDVEDANVDRGRKRTLPMVIPEMAVRLVVLSLYSAAVAIGFFVWAAGIFGGAAYIALMAPAALAFYYSFECLRKGKAADAQRYSKYAMGVAILAFLAGVLG